MADPTQNEAARGPDIPREIGPPPESNSLAQTLNWSLSTRVAFRFCLTYLLLVSLFNSPIITWLFEVPHFAIPIFGTMWPMRQMTSWVAAHIFGVSHPLVYQHSGSGDKIFDWVLAFCLLVIVLAVKAEWRDHELQLRQSIAAALGAARGERKRY
jgi:hypothetical protein